MVNIRPNSGSDENLDPINTNLRIKNIMNIKTNSGSDENLDPINTNLRVKNIMSIKTNSGSDENLNSGEKEFGEPICELLQKLWDNLVDYFSELQTNWSESNNDIDETLPNNEKNESLPEDIITLPYQESELKEPIQDRIEPVKEPIQDPIEPVKKPNFFRRFGNFLKNIIRRKKPDE